MSAQYEQDDFEPIFDGVVVKGQGQPTGARMRIQPGSVEDSGPYYLFTAGEPFYFHDMKALIAGIEPCAVTAILDSYEMVPLNPGDDVKGPIHEELDRDGNVSFQRQKRPIRASGIRDSLLDERTGYDERGLIEIGSFAKMDPRRLRVDKFNETIAPTRIYAEQSRTDNVFHVPERYRAEVAQTGALAIRRRFVMEARQTFSSPEFVSAAPPEIQRAYLGAIDEILMGFDLFTQWATVYMDGQDRAVIEKEKRGYDALDRRLMWLLGRAEADRATTRALDALNRPVVIEGLDKILASQGNNGLTADAIAAIAGQAAASAAATVMAAMSPQQIKRTEDEPAEIALDLPMVGAKPKNGK